MSDKSNISNDQGRGSVHSHQSRVTRSSSPKVKGSDRQGSATPPLPTNRRTSSAMPSSSAIVIPTTVDSSRTDASGISKSGQLDAKDKELADHTSDSKR